MVTLDEYKQMSDGQRNGVKKKDVMALLDEVIDESNVLTKLDVIINELKEMKAKNDSYDNDIQRIDGTVNDHSKILTAHQKFMEDIDAEKRAKHMIVLGLKENGNENDKDKVLDIIKTIGVEDDEAKVENVMRLGKKDENQANKTRPLKVTFEQSNMRNNVLKNAKNLKDQLEGSPYYKVYLKKDQHPEVRAEEKRLYDVFKAETNKAENADKEVVFNRRTRIVTVNGDEIDRFKLFSSFQ